MESLIGEYIRLLANFHHLHLKFGKFKYLPYLCIMKFVKQYLLSYLSSLSYPVAGEYIVGF
jgi:hypothetical protein